MSSYAAPPRNAAGPAGAGECQRHGRSHRKRVERVEGGHKK